MREGTRKTRRKKPTEASRPMVWKPNARPSPGPAIETGLSSAQSWGRTSSSNWISVKSVLCKHAWGNVRADIIGLLDTVAGTSLQKLVLTGWSRANYPSIFFPRYEKIPKQL